MKLVRILLFTIVYFYLTTNSFGQYITVNESYTPTQLVENILINNPCASISNVSMASLNQSGGDSYGYFTAATSSFPFYDGVILSTGRAISAIGPNSSILSEGPTSWQGDNDLQNALGVNNSINATVLEFDFMPISTILSFDYIFSSEQYLSNPSSNQCNFTDGFVFLLKEANTTNPYQNLAIIPGTTIPVKVNTVRGQGTICPPANEQYFGGFNGSNHPTNFNGQTTIMKAVANVNPGTLYHIKLVVADQGNNLYDSAIFLKGGSFNIGVNLGDDKLISGSNPLCAGETFQLNATISGATSYKWFKNGTQLFDNITGLPITTPTYEVNSAGTYKVEVIINSSCTATDEVVIEYTPIPTLINTTIIQCDDNNDGISIFDLTKTNQIITGGDSQLTIVNYYKSLQDAKDQLNEILNPIAFNNTSTNTIYVRVKNQYGCIAFATITLQISNAVVNPITKDFCDTLNEQDGISQLIQSDFDTITTNITIGLPSSLTVTYHLNYNDALTQINPISVPFTNTTALQQVIYAKLVNGSDCYSIVPVTIKINPFTSPLFDEEKIGICSGIPINLIAPSGYSGYSWNTNLPQTTNQITVDKSGTYIVVITNAQGCKASKTFNVTASEIATVNSIVINDFNGDDNTILINYSGIGDYEFSIDGMHFQDSNYFTNVPSGEYEITIHDKKNCGDNIKKVIVLAYPNFFTPNGDGFNDTWKIENMQIYPNSKLEIFDRYGKLLKNLSANDTGWNGKINNQELRSDDYWFILTLTNGKEIKGHFSLKR